MSDENGSERAMSGQIKTFISLSLLKLAQEDVANEPDEAEALRKVLLLLLAATGGEGVRSIHDWILSAFGPIAGRFRQQSQPWCGGHLIGVARDHGGDHLVAVLPKSLVDGLLGTGE